MSKTFRPWNPERTLLLPPSPVDWVPEHNPVFFVFDLAAGPDLDVIHAYYWREDPRGKKAYDPRMMVLLLLYAYCVGVPSSRKIEKACWEDAVFRGITGTQRPDHSRISDFRRPHLDALAGVLIRVLRLCQKAALVDQNSCHWVRDVPLRGDAYHYRENNGIQILDSVRSMTINALPLDGIWSNTAGIAALAHDIEGLLTLLGWRPEAEPPEADL